MDRKKIDTVKLRQMLRDGQTAKEAAEYFAVSESAISQARKRLDTDVIRLGNLEAAHKILSHELSAADQLKKVSEVNNRVLDLLLKWFEGDDEARRALEEQHSLKGVHYKDLTELLLRVSNQLQGQVELQFKLLMSLYDAEQVASFQEEILQVINEVEPDAKKTHTQTASRKASFTIVCSTTLRLEVLNRRVHYNSLSKNPGQS